MGRCWSWCSGVAVVGLLFVGIPLRYNAPKPENEAKLRLEFQDYVRNFNKSYLSDPEEYERRFHYFRRSMSEAHLLNSVLPGSRHSARFGATPFSDMSKEEFAALHLSDEKAYPVLKSNKYGMMEQITNEVYERRKRDVDLPKKFDWRDKGFVGPIYNQGLCGACWAFATVGAMETMAAIQTGHFEPFSVQEMVDCAGMGNRGCDGGDICLLLAWLTNSRTAVLKESLYTPLSRSQNQCTVNGNSTGVKLAKASCGSMVDREDEILGLLATHGPVAVAVNALSWQHYIGGVIQHHCENGVLDLNHAVELVGYDLTAEVPHYIARNSWGSEFGEGGYVRLKVGGNLCGLANEVASVDVTL